MAVNALASAGIEQRGAVFTRKEVVEFILDLAGYTPDRPLAEMRLLEPSFGGGDFLIAAIDRLLEAWVKAGRPEPYRSLANAIRAVELHRHSFENTSGAVVSRLVAAGIARPAAESLADRQLVADDFHLKAYVDMVDTPAFHSDVIAYPAIIIIDREKSDTTRIAHRPAINAQELIMLSRHLTGTGKPDPASGVKVLHRVVTGAEPWILETSDQLALIRRLEQDFPAIEDAGCKVGIGVATGADQAFIGQLDELDVEEDRKLPLAMTRDIVTGHVQWRGLGVINPFNDKGGLVDLREYPRLRRHLEARREQIARRHVAQKAPTNWYRTIDRIYPALAAKPKLLIPDIKGEAQIVYENEGLYPHHNLYYITSETWDLRALQAVLVSGIARLFVAVYSTKMRGGYLRFQAQYLRRIRIPAWENVPQVLRERLIAAAASHDAMACNQAVFELYGLSPDERSALGGNGV